MIDKISNQQHAMTSRLTNTSETNNQELSTFIQNQVNKVGNEKTEQVESNNQDTLDKKKAEELVEDINELLDPVQTSLKFEFHDKLDRYYVTVIDKDTKEVIKEIPPKKMLDLYASIAERFGFLMDEKV